MAALVSSCSPELIGNSKIGRRCGPEVERACKCASVACLNGQEDKSTVETTVHKAFSPLILC